MKFFFKTLYKLRLKQIFLFVLVRSVLKIKVYKYRFLYSDIRFLKLLDSRLVQPTQFVGDGLIELNKCCIGVWPSPGLFTGVSYFEARNKNAFIKVNADTVINNNAKLIADKGGITIGKNCLIGGDFVAFNSDFHDLRANDIRGNANCEDIVIMDNVFIGQGVTVLKGVVIEDGAVIASGSVVVSRVESNCIYAGVPAKKIRFLS